MGARSTKLSKGTSSLTLATAGSHDKYLSTLSLNTMSASDWNLVVKDSFNPEAVGLPGQKPQTKYIGPKPTSVNLETVKRPKQISDRLSRLTTNRMNRSVQSESRTKSAATSMTPLIVESVQSGPGSPSRSKDPKLDSAMPSHKYRVYSSNNDEVDHVENQSATNGIQSHNALVQIKRNSQKVAESSDPDSVNCSTPRGTTKSLTNSEKATLDYLDQVLIVDELQLFEDLENQVESERATVSIPEMNADISLESIEIKPPEILTNEEWTTSPVHSELGTSRAANFGRQKEHSSGVFVSGDILSKTSPTIPKPDYLDDPEVPKPDYDLRVSSAANFSVISTDTKTVAESIAKSSEESFDSPPSFVLPAAESSYTKQAKQIAYVKPQIKSPSTGMYIPARDYDSTPLKSSRVKSMVVDTPSHFDRQRSAFKGSEDVHLKFPSHDDMNNPSVKNMVKQFEQFSPDKLPQSARDFQLPKQPVNHSRPPSWVH